MSHLASIYTKDGNLLFNEATGSSSFNKLDDLNFYDTDSGKWYRTVFDIEQAFWASRYYEIGAPPDPIPVDMSPDFALTPIAFTPTEMDMDMLDTKPKMIGALDGTIKATWSHYYEPDF